LLVEVTSKAKSMFLMDGRHRLGVFIETDPLIDSTLSHGSWVRVGISKTSAYVLNNVEYYLRPGVLFC